MGFFGSDENRAKLVFRPVAETEEDGQSFIDRPHLAAGQFAEHAPDPPFVDGSNVIDQRKRPLREAALSGRKRRIENPLARGSRDRYHAYEREALVACYVRITDDDAGSHTALFVSDGWVEVDDDHATAA